MKAHVWRNAVTKRSPVNTATHQVNLATLSGFRKVAFPNPRAAFFSSWRASLAFCRALYSCKLDTAERPQTWLEQSYFLDHQLQCWWGYFWSVKSPLKPPRPILRRQGRPERKWPKTCPF